RIDIDKAVMPGHDMVVNHLDGSQELAQGHVARAVMEQEAATNKFVPVDKVKAVNTESPRSPDPETNGPDQQVPGQTADEVVAASQPAPAEEQAEEAPVAEEAPAAEETPAVEEPAE